MDVHVSGDCRGKLPAAGFVVKHLPKIAPPRAHVVCLGFGGKAVFMYETVDISLAEQIQNLEGEHGLLPLFGTPFTAVWVPLQLLRDTDEV